MKRWARQLALLLLTALMATGLSARPRLLLAGGHLPVCSSAAADACQSRSSAAPIAPQPRYQLDAAGIRRVAGSGWLAHRSAERDRLIAALWRWHRRAGDTRFDPEALASALDEPGVQAPQQIWAALADFERERVLDGLELAPLAETVNLADSQPAVGAQIYREFVAMAAAVAKRQRPHVLISTASGRDPFESIAFYTAVFEQAGAEVRWLPLDHALRAAQSHPARDCNALDRLRGEQLGAHDRARHYPQHAAELAAACLDPSRSTALIDWADGVFLNGGDQSFTRAAWFDVDGHPSAALTQLLQRLNAGRLVLGGSSAGTAVQSARPRQGAAAMLVSGSSLVTAPARAISKLPPVPGCAQAQACQGIADDALLYHPGGGLGSFALGVLDTHFAQRGREYRLARLLLDSGVGLGVGIDEATALRVDVVAGRWRGRVIGSGGVSLLQPLTANLLGRRRYLAGETIAFPLAMRDRPRCGATLAPAARVDADSAALTDWLDGVADDRRWHPLQLVAGALVVDAGAICASRRTGQRWWRLTTP